MDEKKKALELVMNQIERQFARVQSERGVSM